MAEEKLIVCDTNIFIHLLVGNKDVIEAISQIRNERILMSVISAMELSRGASNKEEQKATNDFINRHNLLILNSKCSLLAFELLKKYHLSHGLAIPDALIAANVITSPKTKLFTFNVKDFDFIKGLEIYYPSNLSHIKRKK